MIELLRARRSIREYTGRASDVWIEDCSIAAILLLMTAQSLGLGSCWVQVRNRMFDDATTSGHYIQNLLAIPEHVKVEGVISIGYPAEQREPLAAENLEASRIRINNAIRGGL